MAHSCVPNVAPAAMPLPAEAREGSSSLVGDTCACHGLMASTTTDDFQHTVYDDEESLRSAKH